MIALSYWAVVGVAYGPLIFGSSRLKAAGAGIVVVLFTLLVRLQECLYSPYACILAHCLTKK